MPTDTDADDPASELKDGMLRHWNGGLRKDDTTDLIIKCRNDTFHVHKNVLMWQCKFFGNALSQANGFKEARAGVINMDHDDSVDVLAMLEYLYTYNYRRKLVDEMHDTDDLMLFHIQIYAIAEKYDIPKLKRLAASKFALTLDDENRGYEADFFPYIVEKVYATTPDSDRGLRDIVIKVCKAQQGLLMASMTFLRMADTTPGVWRDFTRELLGLAHDDPKSYTCPKCTATYEVAVEAEQDGSQNRAQHICEDCDSVLVRDELPTREK